MVEDMNHFDSRPQNHDPELGQSMDSRWSDPEIIKIEIIQIIKIRRSSDRDHQDPDLGWIDRVLWDLEIWDLNVDLLQSIGRRPWFERHSVTNPYPEIWKSHESVT